MATINVEYAKSSRATCKKCKQSIGEGTLRVGPMVQSYMGDFLVPMWHHLRCFLASKYLSSLKDVDQLAGIGQLRAEDQLKLRELVETPTSTNAGPTKGGKRARKRAASVSSESNDDEQEPKAKMKPKSEADAELLRQSGAVWEWRRRISSTVSAASIRAILVANGQPTTGTRFGGADALQTRLAEAFVFGALPKCSVCATGDLVFSSVNPRGYICTGFLDEYALCGTTYALDAIATTPLAKPTNTTTEVKGGAACKSGGLAKGEGSALRPSSIKEIDALFKGYVFKPTTRVSLDVAKKNSSDKSEESAATTTMVVEVPPPPPSSKLSDLLKHFEQQQGHQPTSQLLANQRVIFAGRQLGHTQKELGVLVAKAGGATTTDPAEATMCVCSSDVLAEARKNASGTSKACVIVNTLQLPCLKEGLLLSLRSATPLSQAVVTEFLHEGNPLPAAKSTPTTTSSTAASLRSVPVAAARSSAGRGGSRVMKVQATGAVDAESGFGDDATIYSPTGSEREGYNATLSVVNIQTGQNGFYILQLVQHGKQFSVFRRWGRVGSDHIGGKKLTSYTSLSSALAEFRDVFQEKSGNDWEDLASKARAAGPTASKASFFTKQPGKGVLVDTDYVSSSSPFDSAQPQVDYTGVLPPSTQDLMRLIFDIKAMQTALKELHIDTEKMPLGKLSRVSIAHGYSALSAIEALLSEPVGEEGGAHRRHTKLVSLSNKFYSFVPHVLEGGESPILSTAKAVAEKTTLLNELTDLCAAYETAMKSSSAQNGAALSGDGAIHPVDESYKKLNSDLREVPNSSKEFKQIADYVKSTHGPTHTSYRLELQDLWSVERADESSRFAPHAEDPNRMLLWHGSRVTNWGGILSQGLRIAPPEAPVTGYMFGKGVYFADVVTKSASYCATSRESNIGLMALCEVALGEMSRLKHAKFVTKLPTGCKSTMGVGRYNPDPEAGWIMDNGCKVPTGKVVKAPTGTDGDLLYNEYIVYDVSQIRTRYLLKLKFQYH